MRWLTKSIRRERRTIERARRRFVRKPSQKRLHDLRTSGRRLRSLLEDVSDLAPHPKLLRRIRRVAAMTDAARDAAILLALLDASLSGDERAAAEPLREELQRRLRFATKRARNRLRGLRFA